MGKKILVAFIFLFLIVFSSASLMGQDSKHELYVGIGYPLYNSPQSYSGSSANAAGHTMMATLQQSSLVPVMGYQYCLCFLEDFSF